MRPFTPIAAAVFLAVAGCQSISPQDQANLGLLGGAAAGVLTAQALNANPEWTIAGGLAGAVIGTVVARNAATGQCAYANGDGTYSIAPCPAGLR